MEKTVEVSILSLKEEIWTPRKNFAYTNLISKGLAIQ
jgi:hypothetical protein